MLLQVFIISASSKGVLSWGGKTSKINAMRNIVPWYMHIAPIQDRDTYDNIENQYGRRFESIQFDA